MEVTIYTTPACPWCHKTKEFFKEHNVKYKEVNALENQKAFESLMEKSGQLGVPQTEIKDNDQTIIIIGFDKEALKKALKLK